MGITSTYNALQIVLDNTENLGVEEIDFLHSFGRFLKEDVLADRDFPPFDRVSMDGIAISSKAFNNGIRAFKTEGIQPAGSEQMILLNPSNCIEVMTGAVLPKNTDVVIQYELLDIKDGIANVDIEAVKVFQNIHKKGFDGIPARDQNAGTVRLLCESWIANIERPGGTSSRGQPCNE